MKSNAQSTFYFSAYPLRALSLTETEQELYDKRRSGVIHIKSPGKIRVLPMTNPYRLDDFESAVMPTTNLEEMERKDVSWYSNYE